MNSYGVTTDSIVSLATTLPSDEVLVRRRGVIDKSPSRRAVLRAGVIAAGSILALRVVKIVPMDRAGATHEGVHPYQIQGDCTGDLWYNDVNESCSRPCGGSTIFSDSCVATLPPADHKQGYHRNMPVTAPAWYSLRPNGCSILDSTWDGWKWNHPNCPPCSAPKQTQYRCHDGYKNYTDGTPRNKSICRWTVVCV